MGAENDEVRVEKVSRVVPSKQSGQKRVVFLSSCDLVCRSYPYINRIFFFNNRESSDAVQVMRDGLAEALVSFGPLSGRLETDVNGRLQIVCDGEDSSRSAGAEFVEATCGTPFSSLMQDGFQYRRVFWNLARRTNYLRCDYQHEPILSVQVTQFKGGEGYSVGVSMSHAVADAQSFYDFVYCWGEICRGVEMTSPPLHMRTALSVGELFPTQNIENIRPVDVPGTNGCSTAEQADSCPGCHHDVPDQLSKDVKCQEPTALPSADEEVQNGAVLSRLVMDMEHMDLVEKKSAALQTVLRNGQRSMRVQAPIMEKQLEEEEHRRPRSDLVQKVFSFSSEKLQQLKIQVNKGWICGNSSELLSKMSKEQVYSKHAHLNGQQPKFTTFEAFCAHWWQCLIRARQLPPTQTVCLLIPINCRVRFLNLPHSYFGNALDGGLVKMVAGELCKSDLYCIASKINDAIKGVTEDSFKQYIRAAESERNAIPHFDRTGLFHVVDSPKYPVYDIDFGFGKPQAVRAEGFRFGAEVQILEGREGYGSYDLFCALDADVMERLEHDQTFLSC